MGYEIPSGYAETMDKLKRPDNWDVPGVIADVAEDLRRSTDNGAALAVIDTLCFRMKDIAELISQGHARRIDPNTIRKAGEIAASFVSDKWLHEDELPDGYPYDFMFKKSEVRGGVRMFPRHTCHFTPSIDGGTLVCDCGAWK